MCTQKPFQLIAFGDSTTAPRLVDGQPLPLYCDLLNTRFKAMGCAVDLVNAGVGGNHTDLAEDRFQSDVLERLNHTASVVVIQFGINDAAVDVWKNPPVHEPRVPIDRYASRLRQFITAVCEQNAHPILMTPNPMCWTDTLRNYYGKPPYDPNCPDGINRFINRYAERVRQLAKKEQVPLVDIHQAYVDHRQTPEGHALDFLLPDGMHPNVRGHALVAEKLLPALTEILQPI